MGVPEGRNQSNINNSMEFFLDYSVAFLSLIALTFHQCHVLLFSALLPKAQWHVTCIYIPLNVAVIVDDYIFYSLC